jgi:hypothetical protein
MNILVNSKIETKTKISSTNSNFLNFPSLSVFSNISLTTHYPALGVLTLYRSSLSVTLLSVCLSLFSLAASAETATEAALKKLKALNPAVPSNSAAKATLNTNSISESKLKLTKPLRPNQLSPSDITQSSKTPAAPALTKPAPSGDFGDRIKEMAEEDAAPEPEYPQPGAKQDGDTRSKLFPEMSVPIVNPNTNSSLDLESGPNAGPKLGNDVNLGAGPELNQEVFQDLGAADINPELELPKPKYIDPETEAYYYDRAEPDLSKNYSTKIEPDKFEGNWTKQRPSRISVKGEYIYDLPKIKPRKAISMRFASTPPPLITRTGSNINFTDIYGSGRVFGMIVDYEKILAFGKLGRLGLKFGSGIYASTGTGKFKDPLRAAEKVEERFTFVTLPNAVTGIYLFQNSPSQWFVPFLEGGAGYNTSIELRDDGKAPKFAATPVLVGAGGLRLFLDWIDPKALQSLNNDYGIAHTWLLAEYRQIIGLNKALDFTGGTYQLGIAFDF